MLFNSEILIYLSVIHFSISTEYVSVDKNMIELRLVQDVIQERVDLHHRFPWHYMKSVHISRSLDKGIEIFQQKEYNRDLPAIIIIHGFRGSADKHNPHMRALIKKNYQKRFNLLALDVRLYFDWSSGNMFYLLPLLRAKLIGEALGELLNEAIDKGFITADKINFMGFSLGAQMSGYVARTVRGEVNSILGLEPAGPGFDSSLRDNLPMIHLSKSDARLVHVYHTNMNSFGTSLRVATADFVFNNGWYQPGCMTTLSTSSVLFCNHRRALIYFTFIINRPELFLARKCDSYWNFKYCWCSNNEIINLTFPPSTNANGTYYLTTSSDNSTWGEGLLGTMCPHDRTMKLISDGVINPTPTLYEKLLNFKPNLSWQSWNTGNLTGIYDSYYNEYNIGPGKVTSDAGVPKDGSFTRGSKSSGTTEPAMDPGEPHPGYVNAAETSELGNNNENQPSSLSNMFAKATANVLSKQGYAMVTQMGKPTMNLGIDYPKLMMKFPWMIKNPA